MITKVSLYKETYMEITLSTHNGPLIRQKDGIHIILDLKKHFKKSLQV